MSNLDVFLTPPVEEEEREVVISKRWRDENGDPVPFKIRAISGAENDAIIKKASKFNKITKQKELDTSDYSNRLIVAATVYPDFSSVEMLEYYGAGRDPLLVPGKMLLAGEIAKLMTEISSLSGFDEDPEEEVKN